MEAAKTALITDASDYYADPVKHKKRKHWKQLGLVDYGRSKSIASIHARETAIGNNRLVPLDDRRRQNVDEFESKVDSKYGNANKKIQNLFN